MNILSFPFIRVLLVAFIASGVATVSIASAQIDPDTSSFSYPISELGNCASESDCFAYCDLEENQDACYAFATANGLIDEDDAEHYEEINDALASGEGPGGCASHTECEAYCNDAANIDECIAFGEANGLLDETQLEEAEKIQTALESGATLPGGCSGKDECEAYCEDPDHMEECFAFAEAAGFIDEDEVEDARRAMELMQSGDTPGGCTSRESCEAYCEVESNFDECLSFAVDSGHINEKEAELMRSKGSFGGPGGCSSEEECETYCDANQDECMEYAIASGHMTEDEAEIMRATGGKGPGGCEGESECQAFCSDPENQQTCMDFAGEHGLIDEEDIQMIEMHFQGPGGCLDPESCMEYCSDETNFDECQEMMQYKGEMKSFEMEYEDGGDDYDDYDYDEYDSYDNFPIDDHKELYDDGDSYDNFPIDDHKEFYDDEYSKEDYDDYYDEAMDGIIDIGDLPDELKEEMEEWIESDPYDEPYPYQEHDAWEYDEDEYWDEEAEEEYWDHENDGDDYNGYETGTIETYDYIKVEIDDDTVSDTDDYWDSGSDHDTSLYPFLDGTGNDDEDSKHDSDEDDGYDEWDDIEFDLSEPHYYEYEYEGSTTRTFEGTDSTTNDGSADEDDSYQYTDLPDGYDTVDTGSLDQGTSGGWEPEYTTEPLDSAIDPSTQTPGGSTYYEGDDHSASGQTNASFVSKILRWFQGEPARLPQAHEVDTKNRRQSWQDDNTPDRIHSDDLYDTDVEFSDASLPEIDTGITEPFLDVGPPGDREDLFVSPYELGQHELQVQQTVWSHVLDSVKQDLKTFLEI